MVWAVVPPVTCLQLPLFVTSGLICCIKAYDKYTCLRASQRGQRQLLVETISLTLDQTESTVAIAEPAAT